MHQLYSHHLHMYDRIDEVAAICGGAYVRGGCEKKGKQIKVRFFWGLDPLGVEAWTIILRAQAVALLSFF